MAKKKAARAGKTKELFGAPDPGRIWVSSGEQLTEEVILEAMITSGKRHGDNGWSIGVPLDRLSLELRRALVARVGPSAVYSEGYVSLPKKRCTTLSPRPTTEQTMVAWITKRIQEHLSEVSPANVA